MEIAPTKLDALTSLRFIAAAMIVITHSYTAFGMEADALQPFNFGQAVSFFFVLFGFIPSSRAQISGNFSLLVLPESGQPISPH
jgi:peptidoglycan/LPS O-acetylase OafA/YrhL